MQMQMWTVNNFYSEKNDDDEKEEVECVLCIVVVYRSFECHTMYEYASLFPLYSGGLFEFKWFKRQNEEDEEERRWQFQ